MKYYVAYQMAPMPVTLSDLKVSLAVETLPYLEKYSTY